MASIDSAFPVHPGIVDGTPSPVNTTERAE
jgi:hypothetical protein